MMLVFNNPVLVVVDYPGLDAIEVIDKRSGKGMFVRDGAARRFREDFREFVAQQPDLDEFDEFLDEYGELMTQPTVIH
ncbi:MAG: DUF3567 family protein [Pseudomonadota bacterium]|jgi:hypothetical protein